MDVSFLFCIVGVYLCPCKIQERSKKRKWDGKINCLCKKRNCLGKVDKEQVRKEKGSAERPAGIGERRVVVMCWFSSVANSCIHSNLAGVSAGIEEPDHRGSRIKP